MSPAPPLNLAGLPLWAGLAVDRLPADLVVAGIPMDAAASYRPGARLAPARIRELSRVIPPVSDTGRNLAGLSLFDAGDLPVTSTIEFEWAGLADRLCALAPSTERLLVLGGDHTVVIPTLVAQRRRVPGELRVLYVDAHPDLCDVSRGTRWSHGSALRRALELAELSPSAVMIVGCRDFDAEELTFARDQGITLLTMAEVESTGVASVAEQVRDWARDASLHISFDIDSLDPAAAPGTTVPAPGGFTTRAALTLLQSIEPGSIAGMDLVEVCPPADHGDITTLAALKLIFAVIDATSR
ncbi:MAG: arginase family protein [Candidatus Dormibacteria bacterium]